MAVTLTIEKVKAQARVVDLWDHFPIRPGVTTQRQIPDEFWTAKLAAVKAMVERYAPEAPEVVQNEAALRSIAYLVDRFASRTMVSRQGYSDNQAPGQISCLRHSGGMALLSPWKVRRAGAV